MHVYDVLIDALQYAKQRAESTQSNDQVARLRGERDLVATTGGYPNGSGNHGR